MAAMMESHNPAFTPERLVVVAFRGRTTPCHTIFTKERLRERTDIPVEEIATTANPAEYCGRLQALCEPGDLIIPIGGDGTAHHVTRAWYEIPPEESRDMPLLPLWGGNANDFASMVNLPEYRKRPFDILRDGHVADAWPLRSTIVRPEADPEKDIGIDNISFGVSALLATLLNHENYRSSRHPRLPKAIDNLLRDAKAARQALQYRRPVDVSVTHGAHQDTVRREVDRLYAPGDRIARYGRLPSRLNERAFFELTIPGNRTSRIYRTAGQLLLGQPDGALIDHRSFIVKSHAECQHDGEVHPEPLPAGTAVTITAAEWPLKVLATAL